MSGKPEEFKVHTLRVGGALEFSGLSVLKRWARTLPGVDSVEDVHSNPEWFDKGIDLVLRTGSSSRAVDVKVDSYFGTRPELTKTGWYHPDSGALLIETISQLQYDREHLDRRPDQPGWFFTTQADEIWQYYLPVTGPYEELARVVRAARTRARAGATWDDLELELLRIIQVERDLLITYPVTATRDWWKATSDAVKGEFVGAANPGYVTVSRRVDRSAFTARGPGILVGPILDSVRTSLGHAGHKANYSTQTQLDGQ